MKKFIISSLSTITAIFLAMNYTDRFDMNMLLSIAIYMIIYVIQFERIGKDTLKSCCNYSSIVFGLFFIWYDLTNIISIEWYLPTIQFLQVVGYYYIVNGKSYKELKKERETKH